MKLFQRRIENFVCSYCGFQVTGSGYTNHCPKCLYSKHVDINPGDRAQICQGLMEPVGVSLEHNEYIILHKCLKCRLIRKNKIIKDDDFNLIIKLTLQP